MLNFDNLVNDIKAKDKIEDYLSNFFTAKHYKEYEIDDSADKDQVKAIKIMFESKKDLNARIDSAFSYDPFCKEAFFAYMMLSEDVYLQMRFNVYYDELNSYPSFDDYQKNCYLVIMHFYVDFLLDINNITGAIKIQKLIMQLKNKTNIDDVCRLSYMYFSIENAEEFYRLYLNNKFDAYCYLLLIVTLLKHDEFMKAEEVLMDMYDNVEYGTYLDHSWDLDESDPVQKDFMKLIDDSYEDLVSIPTFFSWVNKTREKHGK